MPYKDTIEDFNLKWNHSFALCGDKLVYVFGGYWHEENNKEEEDKENRWFVQLGDETKKNNIDNFDLESLTPILVNSQFFNGMDLDGPSALIANQTACLQISRAPRRQNKRSLCSENSTVLSPVSRLISQIKGRWPDHYNLGFQHVRSILANKYPTYSEALRYCKTHVAVALSPDFAVSLSSLVGDKYLFLSQFGFIGEADENTIWVKHKGSLQEVNDFVYRNRLQVRVIDAT